MDIDTTKWDVVVVGGGPAGMMAASRAAEMGAKVLLLEKNKELGEKLLITGGGRCNVTNSQFDNRKLLEKFKENGKFLFSAFSQYSVTETLEFFHSRGMETKVENELRTFPITDSARTVWNVLVEYLREGQVEIFSNSPVIEIIKENNLITAIKLKNGKTIESKTFIIATGGTSRPETGSTGDGFKWLAKLGHNVTMPTPSLVPIAIKDKWIKDLAGISLPEVKITVFQNEAKQLISRGKILFTHIGITGPTVLNMSKDVGELLQYGEVNIALDILPNEDYSTLNTLLQDLFKKHDKKKLRNALSEIIPTAIVPVILEQASVDGETACNSVSRESRIKLVNQLKNLKLEVKGLLGFDKAIIASGGVELSEVDFKTMQSKLYPNLYLIGDILNIDRPSGGYSLQLCWTTGYVAGTSAPDNLG